MDSPLKFYSSGAYSIIAIVLLIALVILLFPLLFLGIAGAAFSRLGFSWVEAVAVILLMLVLSLVNIPLFSFRPSHLSGDSRATVFDAFSGEPLDEAGSRVSILLNLGGAVIPCGVCFYLLYETGRPGLAAVALPLAACLVLVALVTFFSTTIHPAWGLRPPLFLPALTALACGLLLTGGTGLEAGVVATAGGMAGILLGATVRGLTAGVRAGIRQVSIGGSGMFWPVFLCAVLSALIA